VTSARISPLKKPIFVALDVDDEKTALKIIEQTQEYVGGYKLGPRLIYRYGQALVKKIAQESVVFVDCKFHDIPSTVSSALTAAFESGASFATIHASNGLECMREIAALEEKLNEKKYFKVLAVTVLTSFSDESLPSNWLKKSSAAHVSLLAAEVIASGLSGLVCAPTEVETLREKYANAFLLTPGVRLASASAKDDQKRIMTPDKALRAGSSALVVGRPIVEAKDPKAAAKEIALLCRP
jgi:orotidine-5'-phosphate decarboxylase